jgi:hypothetical protein
MRNLECIAVEQCKRGEDSGTSRSETTLHPTKNNIDLVLSKRNDKCMSSIDKHECQDMFMSKNAGTYEAIMSKDNRECCLETLSMNVRHVDIHSIIAMEDSIPHQVIHLKYTPDIEEYEQQDMFILKKKDRRISINNISPFLPCSQHAIN